MKPSLEYAGYLPGLSREDVAWERLTFSRKDRSLDVLVPSLNQEQIRQLAHRLRLANRKVHKVISVSALVEALDQTIELLLDRSHPARQKMDDLLPVVTGFDAEMSRLAMSGYLRTFRKPQLLTFLAQDFGNPMVLDEFQPALKGGYCKAIGEELAVHVWAGNVPGLPLWSLISGLLVKSGTLGKVASAEPLLAGWFAQLLVQVEPRLADCLAVVWWKGGDSVTEKAYFQNADAVVAYGSSAALTSIQQKLPPNARFLPHGHKLSLAVVAKEALDSRKATLSAHHAALDVIRFDQSGCYSLQMIYVERGGSTSPQDFAGYLSQELSSYAKRYPLRELSLEERQTTSRWLQGHEFSGRAQDSRQVNSGEGWAVVYSDLPLALQPSALNRTVLVCAVDNIEQVADLTSSARIYLQSAGVAASPRRLFELSDRLGHAGVTRISALGKMTVPDAGWHHDGRFSLLDLTHWVDIEASAHLTSESFAPYAD